MYALAHKFHRCTLGLRYFFGKRGVSPPILKPKAINFQNVTDDFNSYKSLVDSFVNDDRATIGDCFKFIEALPSDLRTHETQLIELIQEYNHVSLTKLLQLLSYASAIKRNEKVDIILKHVSLVLCKHPFCLENGLFDIETLQRCLESLSRLYPNAVKSHGHLCIHLNKLVRVHMYDILATGRLVDVYQRLRPIINPKSVDALVYAIMYMLPHFSKNDLALLPNLMYKYRILNKELINMCIAFVTRDLVGSFGNGDACTRFIKGFESIDAATNSSINCMQCFFKANEENMDQATAESLCLLLNSLAACKATGVDNLMDKILECLGLNKGSKRASKVLYKFTNDNFLKILGWLSKVNYYPLHAHSLEVTALATADQSNALDLKCGNTRGRELHMELYVLALKEIERRLENPNWDAMHAEIISFLNRGTYLGIEIDQALRQLAKWIENFEIGPETNLRKFISECSTSSLSIQQALALPIWNSIATAPLDTQASQAIDSLGLLKKCLINGSLSSDKITSICNRLEQLLDYFQRDDASISFQKMIKMYAFLSIANDQMARKVNEILTCTIGKNPRVLQTVSLELLLQVPLSNLINLESVYESKSLGKLPSIKILFCRFLTLAKMTMDQEINTKNSKVAEPNVDSVVIQEYMNQLLECQSQISHWLDFTRLQVYKLYSRCLYNNSQNESSIAWDHDVPIKVLRNPPIEPLDICLYERAIEIGEIWGLADVSNRCNGSTLYQLELLMQDYATLVTRKLLYFRLYGPRNQKVLETLSQVINDITGTAASIGMARPTMPNLPIPRRHKEVLVKAAMARFKSQVTPCTSSVY
ncbi:hypothetical protein BdWA1_003056 [Babesia duncani]|uniref:Uncharacterized protein n=1 Tax=Babesia duncani TaxID=323732 RepID=A0AAD9PIB9_9APIC|nr:hypothetical protein BdWA1_003056 [Babesia duncani]